jgi:putative ABC transport system substrate-binding protein
MMGRREFITLLGGTAAAWPLAADAQQTERVRRIGVLVGLPEGDPEGEVWAQAFLKALPLLGWQPGANVQIDVRWATPDITRMQGIARELVRAQPDAIQVTSTPATAAILRETGSIPVVFSIVSDPVGSGFIQSLGRPGTNATGFINIEASMGGKWVELLKEISPRISRISFLFNPKTAPQTEYYRASLESAAASLGMNAVACPVDNLDEIEKLILGLPPDSSLIVMPDIFMAAKSQRDLIVALATARQIPVVYGFAFFVRAGGLISYGVDLPDLQRRAASYVDRILKGARPQDLPVQLPTKFELAINLKTAKALGLEVPATLLARADEVIE